MPGVIALDAMGSDRAPKPEVEGAIQAARRFGIHVKLVGPEETLRAELSRHPFARALPISVVHASEVIRMEDKAVQAVRAKRDSSMRVGLRLVREGQAAGFITAGNTGAAMATAKMVLEQIVKNGSVTRGWIGVEVQEITPPVAESFKLQSTRGALVAGVLRGGPADKAGVRPGDVLVEVEGKPVADPTSMLNLIAALAPGNSARMKLRRAGKDVDTNITVGRRPKPQARAE